ncbi:MAG: ABC-F family ATP-binding cassette domain-containing protein [Phycisphaerales bacterium]
MLQVRAVSKVVSFRTLFRDISLTVQPGDRLGIVGPNGAGKSTLLRLLAGLDEPDEGEIAVDPLIRRVMVDQQDAFDEHETARSVVAQAGIDGALDRGEAVEPHEAEVRGDVILGKVGFPSELADQAARTLSGGWRKRLSIARALARTRDEPELLLLDEPTNHLDLAGIRWLEDLVTRLANRGTRAAVIFITHDREFLERVATRVAELSPAYADGLLAVDGNYSAFLRRKREHLDAQGQRMRSVANQVRKDLDWLSRGPQGRGTKAKGRIDRSHDRIAELAELRGRSTAAERGGSAVEFHAGGRKTRRLLATSDVAASVGGRTLFRGVSFRLGAGDRLGLLGPNGSGKTTLIRVITGAHPNDHGAVTLAEPKPSISVFSQHRKDFPPETRLRDALCPTGDLLTFRGQTVHVSGWARRFLFKEQQLEQPVRSLSGGEVARIHIARIMLEPSDILILDEPTNDLDIPTLETMEEALEDFPGALVLVTHDRAMIERLATQVLLLDGSGGAHLHANLGQALAADDARRLARENESRPAAMARPARQRRVKLSYNEQREYDRIERDIEHAEQAAADAEGRLAAPDIIRDHAAMAQACRALEAAQARVADLYDRWDQLERKQRGEA